MQDFAGRIAVVTGGGTGMGRELVRQLVAEGCNVAMCDVSADDDGGNRTPLRDGAAAAGPAHHRASSPTCRMKRQVQRFRDEVARSSRQTDRIHLLFNNAGIGGGGSMIANTREEWERTFNICWGGVYLLHARLSADDADGRPGTHRQHQQRQRVLGIGRAAHIAHRLLCREVRGEGLHRGADHRPRG